MKVPLAKEVEREGTFGALEGRRKQAGTKQLRDGIELVRTPALVDADAVYAVCMGDGISDRAHGVSDERTARAIVAKE